MKSLIIAATILTAAVPVLAADVGVSINVGQPGFYGRIDIGSFPQPQVIYAEPVIIERQVRYVGQPIYLRVPPGHARKWSKHCRAYNACGQQVYFVQDSWYNNVYAPRYRERHDERRDFRDDESGDDHGRGRDKYDRYDKHDKQDKQEKREKHGKGHNKD